MFLRKFGDWLIKQLGGYTSLEYEATSSLYRDYKNRYFKYRFLVGPPEKASSLVSAITSDPIDMDFLNFCTAHRCYSSCKNKSYYCPIADKIIEKHGVIHGGDDCREIFKSLNVHQTE